MNTGLQKQLPVGELPHDAEAEKAILGSLIRLPDFIRDVSVLLTPECFYFPANRIIFQNLVELSTAGAQVDEIILSDSLRDKGLLEKIGDFSYLVELREIWSMRSNLAEYCKIVRNHFRTRELITIAGEIARRSRESGEDITGLISEFQEKLAALGQDQSSELFVKISDVMAQLQERWKSIMENPQDITGLHTGFIDLDKKTSGLQKNDLIILAARPSMGKTAFAVNIAAHSAINEKKNVLIFSLEMSRFQIAERLISSEALVDSTRLRSGKLSQDEFDKIAVSFDKIVGRNLFISDKPGISIMEISNVAHQLSNRLKQDTGSGLDLILVDYLQLVRAGRNVQNREQEISQISRLLKSLAKELSLPLIALSQLNRAVESRKDKRPMMSDIRESGSIEQDADLILFIYRDEVYDKDSKDKGLAEINISKHRNGQTGDFKLNFTGKFTRFSNFSYLADKYESSG